MLNGKLQLKLTANNIEEIYTLGKKQQNRARPILVFI